MKLNLEKLIIGNAAGIVKTPDDVMAMCRSGATRITVGSITKEPRGGNSGEVYYYDEITRTSVNTLGLPNYGIEEYRDYLPKMKAVAELNGKELWASVAGFSPAEFAELTEACLQCGVHGVELNFGCSNIHDGGATKPIFSYHPQMVEKVLMRVRDLHIPVQARPKIGVKISPVEDALLLPLANAIVRSGIVTEVVACNTIPNQTMQKKDGSEALDFTAPGSSEKQHTGGMGGAALFGRTLEVVDAMRNKLLPSDIRVIAVGGIFDGADAYEQLKQGAGGFECATALIKSSGKLNPGVLSDILSHLVDINERQAA